MHPLNQIRPFHLKNNIFFSLRITNDATTTEAPHEQHQITEAIEIDDADDVVPSDEAATSEILRENFQETWIFDTIEIDSDGTAVKNYEALDEITTWQVSAFSSKKNFGISIADPQELTVKNEFFVKLNLPYSIRYTEVLRLDILVYNYVASNGPVEAKIQLENNERSFEFAESDGTKCSWTYDDSDSKTVKLEIPSMSIKKVTLFIRSRPSKDGEKIPSKMNIFVRATATDSKGSVYEDHVQQELKVEPVGIKVFAIYADTFMLNGQVRKKHEIKSDALVGNVNVLVSGDYLTDSVDLSARYA